MVGNVRGKKGDMRGDLWEGEVDCLIFFSFIYIPVFTVSLESKTNKEIITIVARYPSS